MAPSAKKKEKKRIILKREKKFFKEIFWKYRKVGKGFDSQQLKSLFNQNLKWKVESTSTIFFADGNREKFRHWMDIS